jgi:predicted  nucleic acid-binding Zn-ribbon protein
MSESASPVKIGLDAHQASLTLLLTELGLAKTKLEQAIDQEQKDLEEALELKTKASNRTKDARNVYDGIAKRIDKAILELRKASPEGTAWHGDGEIHA